MAQGVDSNRYEGQDLCVPDDVYGELGGIINTYGSTLFPNPQDRDVIMGRWCRREASKFYYSVRVQFFQLKGNELELARDAVLFRICARILRKVQANRTNRPGGTPSYAETIQDYRDEYNVLEHAISISHNPHCKINDEPYPPAIEVDIKVVDSISGIALPGAQVFVNSVWTSTALVDGIAELELATLNDEDDDPYQIVIKFPGYEDSAITEVDDSDFITILMVAE